MKGNHKGHKVLHRVHKELEEKYAVSFVLPLCTLWLPLVAFN